MILGERDPGCRVHKIGRNAASEIDQRGRFCEQGIPCGVRPVYPSDDFPQGLAQVRKRESNYALDGRQRELGRTLAEGGCQQMASVQTLVADLNLHRLGEVHDPPDRGVADLLVGQSFRIVPSVAAQRVDFPLQRQALAPGIEPREKLRQNRFARAFGLRP